MAVIRRWWISCVVLVPFVAYLGSCHSDSVRADGVQPELFIFHESCALKKDEGPCKASKERFYFDIDIGRCQAFRYGGCKGNANNFHTLQACEEMCLVSADKSPCHLEEAPGPCRGLVTRYLFDSQSQECKHFFYGGCFGNANNFKSKMECEARCRNQGKATEAPKGGVTIALVPTNSPSVQPLKVTGKATEAPKGGVTIAQVPTNSPSVQPLKVTDEFALAHMLPNYDRTTELNLPVFCLSPVDKGTCDGRERRFMYNPKTKRCQGFHYSGCGGNKNNFVLKRHCLKMCMKGHRRRTIRIRKKNTNILFSAV